eukprot:TRINITY_DN17584_c0_g1_i1.p1 TRINITY_DN17584_c0_g1~~TRINITY_DN17584_c0_g1_i1.p1  ORF type:complete len:478 (+),score=97.40 TRINITY_DN17584_c0_g1_i1:45-1478(+)
MNKTTFEFAVYAVIIWFVLYLMLEEEAYPKGPIFPIIALYLGAVASGVISMIKIAGSPIPSLLGMLVVGCYFKNVEAVNGLKSEWSSIIKKLALAVILTRAGLVLDLEGVKKLGRPTILMSFVPCIVEASVVAVMSRALLSPTMPWDWCLMLGFIIAAVSPAVVVPSLTDLQCRGYGVSKGIPSMVLAASGIDDVIAVTGFGVTYGIAFSSDLGLSIAQGPIDLCIGIVGGILGGLFLTYTSFSRHPKLSYSPTFKTVTLLLSSVCAILGFGKLGYTGGGALFTMVSAVVVKKYTTPTGDQEDEAMTEEMNGIEATLAAIWELVAKPLLFVLIGSAVELGNLTGEVMGYGTIILAVGLIVILPSVVLVTHGSSLNFRERIFVAIAWLPKATVQAALGSIALDKVRDDAVIDLEKETWAENVLSLSVLAIIYTAPVGAVLIEVLGPSLLTKEHTKAASEDSSSNQPDGEENDSTSESA